MVRDPDAGTDHPARPTQHSPEQSPERLSDDVQATKATDVLADGDPNHTPSVDELIAEYDEEKPSRQLSPGLDRVITAFTFAASVFVLWQVFFPLSQGKQYYLIIFLTLVLPLIFLLYRFGRRKPVAEVTEESTGDGVDEAAGRRTRRRRRTDNPGIIDWALAIIAFIVCVYPLIPFEIGDGGGGFNAFLDRQGLLGNVDLIMGFALTILILEATRRTTGLVMPIACIIFALYAYYGGLLPRDWVISHAGINWSQIINAFYNEGNGFFGTPLAVCASYIVLFTIYGAVLERTGAGRFFVDVSFAAFRKSKAAPGRTVTLSGFLLGTVSGSGTATTVTLGSIAWPILRRARYPRENAGGLLAAAGIGAILSPPTLGAAAFIIAEYLQVNYLEVLLWATIPTILYYTGIILAVEIDGRRFGAHAVEMPKQRAWPLIKRFGYHFFSLFVIIFFLAMDIPPFKAIVYAIGVAMAFGLIERLVSKGDPLDPDYVKPSSLPESQRPTIGSAVLTYLKDMYYALSSGIRSVLPVAAVCAAAGIIVSVLTKTGLAQTLGNMLVQAAAGLSDNPTVILIITAVFAALAVTLLGLAVPVTASFIIAWTIFALPMTDLGISRPETAMFIFYYAVLSEVSPPTALAAVAASAITGGKPIATMWQTWKYTLPAFLAPLAFVLTENGSHLLMQGDALSIIWTALVSIIAVAALAACTGGWLYGPANAIERILCIPAALLLLYLQPWTIGIGLGFLVLAFILNIVRTTKNTPSQEAVA
ncbi:TRAP transporter fused permease subunit [Epidermidibacterium keratini]|uniref:TRAP transporter fused permease subunit n=1 Tax=Epidermidibacterium keratini TaxID=1891644 RepID=A0A7L4YPX7_9ACTN|nr:TRAP transporter fused permease subunit [Epidermidibacterium keratini]QHC00934.1 TRAP transporter fused permease subunit [Epidermidibacterium keratini]